MKLDRTTSNFYPRSPCGERHINCRSDHIKRHISIHALLAESDALRQLQSALRRNFYPRSPCGERLWVLASLICLPLISIHALLAESDYVLVNTFLAIFEFLSTLSLRRATIFLVLPGCKSFHFYPRSPCGERLLHASMYNIDIKNFYPRSPCGERRSKNNIKERIKIFLSTLSLRRATSRPQRGPGLPRISIHALLAESDELNINRTAETIVFLSTLSLRRATISDAPSSAPYAISIHALLAESDKKTSIAGRITSNDFYPRSPCGERPMQIVIIIVDTLISIHALLAESDVGQKRFRQKLAISIHALLAESDATL